MSSSQLLNLFLQKKLLTLQSRNRHGVGRWTALLSIDLIIQSGMTLGQLTDACF